MTNKSLNRLLKRQVRKHSIPEHILLEYCNFFQAVNEAYISNENDVRHLEHVLEHNSKELYLANKKLQEEVDEVALEVIKSKEQLDKVMANVADVIFEVDSSGRFTYLNPAWIKYSEASVAQSMGRNFMEYSNGIKHFDSEVKGQIINKDFEVLETTFSRYDSSGNLKWWEMNVKLLKSQEGIIEGAIGSLAEVTQIKEKEYELKKANKAKSKFLSTMSHEIRTPLNAVIAISNILLMDEPRDSQLDNINALKFSSRHLLNLINDILDYNKLTSGKLHFDNSPFNLRQIINGTINSFSFSAREKGIHLSTTVSSMVPDGVKGDSLRLSQVLTNLLGNSVKFTNEGHVELEVDIIEESDDKIKLRFSVHDTGIGIAQEKLKNIFERFTQAETHTTRMYGGTGLGLAITKQLLQLQNSRINVESKLGKGTTFWFDLKFDKLIKKELIRIDPEQETQFDLKGMKLLVVDDNQMNLMVIEQFFDKWNVQYDSATNGNQAVEKVKVKAYDVVLMDLQMPVMNGYEAVAEIRKLGGGHSNLPIIALSASVSNEVIVKVVDAGMDDYLSKPFDPIDLYLKLNKLLPARERV